MAIKTIKLDTGAVYQKDPGGTYFFRYQLNGKRKAVSLQTKNQKEAIAKAKEMAPLVKASSLEVVAAHVTHVQSWAKTDKRLELSEAWDAYDSHPDHARPATVHNYHRYKAYFEEFVAWAIGKG
ncbi:MAG: hypothetical protein RBU25_01455, partial [Lentisphaeria bacterium]|nr:hypothetical protein [Lentisphaeria bacterium]